MMHMATDSQQPMRYKQVTSVRLHKIVSTTAQYLANFRSNKVTAYTALKS